jgi:hypothetical protein
MMKTITMKFTLCLFMFLSFVSSSIAAEFTCDVTDISKGEPFGNSITRSRLYVKGEKQRAEYPVNGGLRIVIHRPDKKVHWIIGKTRRIYTESPGGKGTWGFTPPVNGAAKGKDSAWKLVGREKIDGHDCDKFLFTYSNRAMGSEYHWISRKLHFPVRIHQKSATGEMLVTFKNIKEGKLSDSLFEVPKGYKKITKQNPQ